MGGTLTAKTNLTNPKNSLCHCNTVNLWSVTYFHRHPGILTWHQPLLELYCYRFKQQFLEDGSHQTLSVHCSNAAGLHAILGSASASIHWKNGPGSSELAKVEGTPPKSYAWLIQPKRYKLNIWSASYYLLVEKVFLSKLCFILFLFVLSHDYWFSNTSHCNFLHKMIDKEMASSLSHVFAIPSM